MRALAELVDPHDPALPLLCGWASDPAGNGVTLLPPADTLLRLQITTRSMLGTVA